MLLRQPENNDAPQIDRKLRLGVRYALCRLLLLACSATLLAGPAPCAEEAKGKSDSASPGKAPGIVKGFVIKQMSVNQGAISVYICPQHWALKTSLISIAVDEKNDKVIAYTRQTGKYLVDTVATGVRRFHSFRRGGDFSWGPFKQIAREKYQGEDVVVFERRGRRTDLKAKNDVVIIEQTLACPRYKLSKTFQEVAFAIFDTEYKYGLPLKVSRMARSSNPHNCTIRPVVVLETVSTRAQTFPLSEFDVPAGMTRVSTEIDLFNDDAGLQDSLGGKRARVIMRDRELQLNIEDSSAKKAGPR